jgi:diacylglycerol kinase family enzyme
MVAEPSRVTHALVLNRSAGSLSDDRVSQLRAVFPGHTPIEIQAGTTIAEALDRCGLAPEAEVVVAGGDGTIAAAVECLAGTPHVLGIVPLGTFNNFARSLDLPLDFDAAVDVVRRGRAREVALGEAGGHIFLEAAAIGIFGDALALGEAAKEADYDRLLNGLVSVVGDGPFRYHVVGDIDRRGRTFAIVAANTRSIGAGLPMADTTPEEPALALVFHGGRNRLTAAVRLIRFLVHGGRRERPDRVRDVTIYAEPAMNVFADLHPTGRTPVRIRVRPAALRVILPAA